MDDVVEQAEGEDDRAARRRLSASRSGSRPGRWRSRRRRRGRSPRRSRSPECRRRARVPAVGARVGPERLSARGQRSRPAMTKKAIGAAAMATSAFTGPAGVADACGIDRRSVTLPVGGHGAGQHPPYNRAVSVYADLIRYRELFASLFQRDLRAKYKGSALGLLWTLALPVTLMLVYLVVFSVMLKARGTDVDHYWLFLLCGLPPWVFFATSVQSSARSLLENASLIRKVRFPRQLVPLSIVATQLVAFAVMTGDRARARDDRAARLALDGVARDPDRGRDRPVRLGPVACHRLGERDLPGHRVRGRGAAPAALLPDADPLHPRQSPRCGDPPVARRPDPVGQSADPV